MKSNVSDYLEIMDAVYTDATMKCSADVSDLRDRDTIRSRVEKEGLSFLTITLPTFARDLEKALAVGFIDSTLFRCFRKWKNGPIPAFLRGMVSLIFDHETGRLINHETEPPFFGGSTSDISTLVDSVRQICLTFKKVEFDCSSERISASLESFTTIEQDFNSFSVPDQDRDDFHRVAGMLWGVCLSSIRACDILPSHGPGATADKYSGNRKYQWRRWHDRLEPFFPLIDTAYPLGIAADRKELEIVTIVPEEQEQPVRVVTVPKTLKSPRVIAIEPCCMQYVQQGIKDVLYERLQSYWLTRGHVNFDDQTVNQRLAIDGSKTGQLATIDLSDASDRVPRDLALDMFRWNPELRDMIDACRSTRAELPDGTIIGPLKKFASMGSALCFPVEAMYFYTICVVALLKAENLPQTMRNIFVVSRCLYVYGDDIIVPTHSADVVLDYLHKYNCKVNTNKTFVSGNFRESCGIDAYKGDPVTPVYLRKKRPENKQHAAELISWTATANLFYRKGYWKTAHVLYNSVERIIGPLPYVSELSPALGRISFMGYMNPSERWNRDYQRFEIKGWVPSPVYRTDKLEGYGALMKSFQKLQGLGEFDPDKINPFPLDPVVSDAHHLEHSALHGAVTLKRRWVAPR